MIRISRSKGLMQLVMLLVIVLIAICGILALISWIKSTINIVEEEFIIHPYIYVMQAYYSQNMSKPILVLLVVNKAPKSEHILMVELESGGGAYIFRPKNPIVVPADSEMTLNISSWEIAGSPDPIKPGFRYRVKVYTEETILIYDVVAHGR